MKSVLLLLLLQKHRYQRQNPNMHHCLPSLLFSNFITTTPGMNSSCTHIIQKEEGRASWVVNNYNIAIATLQQLPGLYCKQDLSAFRPINIRKRTSQQTNNNKKYGTKMSSLRRIWGQITRRVAHRCWHELQCPCSKLDCEDSLGAANSASWKVARLCDKLAKAWESSKNGCV